MANWFLIIIYLAFISLGLPDGMLGASWPVMHGDLNMPLEAAGLLSMIVASGTIISSIFSGRLIEKFGTGKLTLLSCIMTASALFGFSRVTSIWMIIPFAIILGIGGGAVDSALNHYVAENYEAKHMNWLHSFWGIGATSGPLIMAFFISNFTSWRMGYTGVSLAQFTLVAILIVTLPMWKKVAKIHKANKEDKNSRLENSAAEGDTNCLKEKPSKNVFKIPGVKYSLVTFLLYCSIEATVGLWGASYLVHSRGMLPEKAAVWVALYYGGITAGRMLAGFISMKVSNRHMIFAGQVISLLGVACVFVPGSVIFAEVGFILIGLGLAPIFPGLLHETPRRFGKANAAKLMGYQMAMAYVGTTFLPPLFGLLASAISLHIFPVAICLLVIGMLVTSERIVRVIK